MELGLLGAQLTHSFSKAYFEENVAKAFNCSIRYHLIERENLTDFRENLMQSYPDLKGFNVTIPYKKAIFAFLDEIDEGAEMAEAVNTVVIQNNGRWKGYNTDVDGFLSGLRNFLPSQKPLKTAIFGTGGAAGAVKAGLTQWGFPFVEVSRSPLAHQWSYAQLSSHLPEVNLLINTTPVGMHGFAAQDLPFDHSGLNAGHFCYDLIYNPALTPFLQKAQSQKAKIKNGLEMLYEQANSAWEIWRKAT